MPELRYHECDRDDSWPEYDARGIYLARVCGKCKSAKLAGFRREVLTNPAYECDEPIEPEDY